MAPHPNSSPFRSISDARRHARTLGTMEWLMAPVLMALAFFLASFAVRNSDFWMHLATGRHIANGNTKVLFGEDPYSHASEGRHWVNHAWLYDVVIYKLYNASASHSAVVFFKAGLAALLALAMFLASRPDARERIVPGTKVDPSGWVAAVAVGIALLAMAPLLLMQQTVISFLFTGVTFLFLQNSRGRPAWWLPAILAPLFAIWVNCDNWFLLGPALVVLFIIGEIVQGLIPGNEPNDGARLKNLALTLAAGLAACLLNPHHVLAFSALPFELDSRVVPEFRKEGLLSVFFRSPLDLSYQNSPEFGRSVAGVTYAALIVAGALSFVLNVFRVRVALLLTWAACLALSLHNWRLIPFFAIVCAPIIALNVQAFFARRPERQFDSGKATEPDLLPEQSVPDRAPVPTAISAEAPREGWWPGATESAPATSTMVSPRHAAAGGMNVTPDTMLAVASVIGRLLTLVAGVGAIWAAYPGWLHPGGLSGADMRANWEVRPDPAFQQVAERLGQWHREGKLPGDARVMPLPPQIGNYLAWFAPEVKGFMDYRFQLLGQLSGDLMQVKRGLDDLQKGVEQPADFRAVLRRHGITHVITADTDRTSKESGNFFATMLIAESEWSLWFQNGDTAVFRWLDPSKGLPREDSMRLDVVEMAFGRQVERIPAPETYGVIRELPPDDSLDRGFWDRYLRQSLPAAPPESRAAMQYLDLQAIARGKVQLELQEALLVSQMLSMLGPLAANPGIPPPAADVLVPRVIARMAQFHPRPVAVNVVAVRDAVRGMLAKPNAGYPHLVLWFSYSQLGGIGADLRPLQASTAAHQALARLTPEQLNSENIGKLTTSALISLFVAHRDRRLLDPNAGEWDLALECLEKAYAQYARFPNPLLTPEQHEEEKKALAKELDTWRLRVKERHENFILEQSRLSNLPVHVQVRFALSRGLVREAYALLQQASLHLDMFTTEQIAKVYLALGKPELADDLFKPKVNSAGEVVATLPDEVRIRLAPVQRMVWIALGDYARAGQAVEKEIASYESNLDPKKFVQAGANYIGWLHFASSESAAQIARLGLMNYGMQDAVKFTAEYLNTQQYRAELHATRGMLALEEGDLVTARKYFTSALEVLRDKETGAVRRFRGDINSAAFLRCLIMTAPKESAKRAE